MKRTLMRISPITVCAVLSAVPLSLSAQDAAKLPEARDVIERYIEAIGGRDAVLSHESRYMKFFFKGPFAEAEFFVYAAKPDRSYSGNMRNGVVVSQSGFTGEVGWSVERDFGPRILVGREHTRAREEADFYADLYDPEAYASLETVELTEFEGRKCYKLRLVSTSGRETFEYFDAGTGLKAGSQSKGQAGNYVFDSSEILDDYREYGGVLIATKYTWRYEGWPYEQVVTVTEVELDNVPDSVFALPAEIDAGSWPVADRVAGLLELGPGRVVADIGAGAGLMSLELARRVGPTGQVLATEILPELVQEIGAQAVYEGITNVSPVFSDQSFTGLPPECCDAILLRFVYHEFTEPAVMNAEMLRALRPGGLVAVIDDAAEGDGLVNGRGNHTIVPGTLIEEMVASGFELLKQKDQWDGHESRFAVLLRRPLTER